MGRSTPQSHAKRQREQQKKDKQRAKNEKRAARKAAKKVDEPEHADRGPEARIVQGPHHG